MKKYLIVSGDSFTKGHKLGEESSWAYHTANKLGLELINLSENGQSNEWISSNILNYLYKNEDRIDEFVVMVGWTDFMRKLVSYSTELTKHQTFTLTANDFTKPAYFVDNQDHPINYIFKNKEVLYPLFGWEPELIYKTYVSMLHLKTFLQKNNIPYLFFESINSNKVIFGKKYMFLEFGINKIVHEIPDPSDEKNVMYDYINPIIINKIYDDNFINFNGFTINQWVQLQQKDGVKIYEEGSDGHTNIFGAKKISEFITEQYERLYNKG